jgi:hypothetical protein
MPRYQLRLPHNMLIEDVLTTMVQHAWQACKPQYDHHRMTEKDYEDFAAETYIGMKPYLAAFDLCGLVPQCAEEIEGNPMVDYEDHLYHLILPCTFAEFVDQLAYSAFYSVKHLLKQKDTGLETMRNIFRRELSNYLYYNPACGRIPVCDGSKSISPWKAKE